MELDIKHLKENIKYCLMNSVECYNEKTFDVVTLGGDE